MTSIKYLLFSSKGLLNPGVLTSLEDYAQTQHISKLLLIGDGSSMAVEHMRQLQLNQLPRQIEQIGIMPTPRYAMRIKKFDGTLSGPHYLYKGNDRLKWICSQICSYMMEIHLIDTGSQSSTEVLLDEKQTDLVCYMSYRLWSVLKLVEDRYCFPAIVVDRLLRYSYHMTKQTMDIDFLRQEIGIASLNYDERTDLLSVSVSDEEYTIKLSVLNEVYDKLLLPIFNSMYGRRLHMRVAMLNHEGPPSEKITTTYGELGRHVEDLRRFVAEDPITADHPITEQDLVVYARKLRLDEEESFWMPRQDDFDLFLKEHYDLLVPQLVQEEDDSLNLFEAHPEFT